MHTFAEMPRTRGDSTPSHRRDRGPAVAPWPERAGRVGLAALMILLAASGEPVHAADPFLVIADSQDGGEPVPLGIPSVADKLESFDQVSRALSTERQRIAELETRLQSLEKKAGGVEPLPAPEEKSAAETSKKSPQKDAKAGGEKAADAKPTNKEPYEIGSDRNLKDTWKDGFQSESANKDFRVKIGGRTQVDAVAFSAAPGPNQLPNKGGLDPELADTVNFRRARFRI